MEKVEKEKKPRKRAPAKGRGRGAASAPPAGGAPKGAQASGDAGGKPPQAGETDVIDQTNQQGGGGDTGADGGKAQGEGPKPEPEGTKPEGPKAKPEGAKPEGAAAGDDDEIKIEVMFVTGRGGRQMQAERFPFALLTPSKKVRGGMEGPSFLIPEGENAENVLAAARKRHKGATFISRKMPTGGVRVWRAPNNNS